MSASLASSSTTVAHAAPGTPLLQVDHLTMRFGGLVAINDLSFVARAGDITALIGPNGAGKTTVFNCITGFYKPTEGMITLTHTDGKAFLLERLADFRINWHAKVARTFQNIRLFQGMTVLENLLVAQHNPLMLASGMTFLGILGTKRLPRQRAQIDRARRILAREDRLGRARGRCGGRTALRRPAPAGDCPRHVHGSRAALPGRARRRPQSQGEPRAQHPSARHPKRARHGHPAHRA